jgi:hypothetical protein
MCVRFSAGAKIGAQLAASAHEQSASNHVLQFANIRRICVCDLFVAVVLCSHFQIVEVMM